MYEGNNAQLTMQTMLIHSPEIDPETYHCTVLHYDEEQELIYMLLSDASLGNIALDAEYTCRIADGEKEVSCKGFIVERYQDARGNILCFRIKAGFYEINIK